jgi:hypothetical protein
VDSHGSGLETGQRLPDAASGRALWPGGGDGGGLGADPGRPFPERPKPCDPDPAGPGGSVSRGGGLGGLLGSAARPGATPAADQLAVAEPVAAAIPAVEPLACGVGAAHSVAGVRGLVSCAWLEPTYDGGTDCLRWHLWLLP